MSIITVCKTEVLMKTSPFVVAPRQQERYMEISVPLRKDNTSLENYIQNYIQNDSLKDRSLCGARLGAQTPLLPDAYFTNVPDKFLPSPTQYLFLQVLHILASRLLRLKIN